jgi:hypothetical protein
MVEAARTNNVFLMEVISVRAYAHTHTQAYWTRFMPALHDLRARIDAGVVDCCVA